MFRIVKKERLNPTVTKMVIDAPFIAKKAEPGFTHDSLLIFSRGSYNLK